MTSLKFYKQSHKELFCTISLNSYAQKAKGLYKSWNLKHKHQSQTKKHYYQIHWIKKKKPQHFFILYLKWTNTSQWLACWKLIFLYFLLNSSILKVSLWFFPTFTNIFLWVITFYLQQYFEIRCNKCEIRMKSWCLALCLLERLYENENEFQCETKMHFDELVWNM